MLDFREVAERELAVFFNYLILVIEPVYRRRAYSLDPHIRQECSIDYYMIP